MKEYIDEFAKLDDLTVDNFVDLVVDEYAEYAKGHGFNWDKLHAAATVARRKEEENVQTRSSENEN